jgi:hypothetical protein
MKSFRQIIYLYVIVMNPSQQLNGYPTNVFANSSGQPVMYPPGGAASNVGKMAKPVPYTGPSMGRGGKSKSRRNRKSNKSKKRKARKTIRRR